uniref:Protein kinase domain-containing protein n=1 Tax=Parascaris univalens TaxID=6257 RepID=A0A915CCV7_PARUN
MNETYLLNQRRTKRYLLDLTSSDSFGRHCANTRYVVQTRHRQCGFSTLSCYDAGIQPVAVKTRVYKVESNPKWKPVICVS